MLRDGKGVVASISVSWNRGNQSGGFHARKGPHASQQLFMKADYFSQLVILLIRESVFHRQNVLSDAAQIGCFQIYETAEKQPGSDQQDHGQGNFTRQEKLPQRRACYASADGPCRVLQRRKKIFS